MTSEAKSRDSYTVGWITALPIERTVGVAMLDEEHGKPFDFTKHPTDPNSYSWGRIGVHNVVIAALPAGMYGQSSATTLATHMVTSFPQIRVSLMVGIGGGVPRLDEEIDIRLGDVVVSQPNGTNGGVAQYDTGKATTNGFQLRGFLNSPPLSRFSMRLPTFKSNMNSRTPRSPRSYKICSAKTRPCR
jgi:hypothetical protein